MPHGFMLSKIIQIHIILTILSFSSSKIFCGDELLTKSCYMTYYENGTLSEYVYPCDFGKFCPKRILATCVSFAKRSGEGKKCLSSLDCSIGICKNGICRVLNNGEVCYADSNCNKFSICGPDKKCEPMKENGESCDHTQNCKIGLECIEGRCGKIGSGQDGEKVDTFFGCQSGYTLLNDKGDYICADLTVSSSCIEKDNKFFCTSERVDINGNISPIEIECEKNWNDEYFCPTERINSFKKYIDSFMETYSSLKKENNNRITNRYTLNSELLSLNYFETMHYELEGASGCIRDHFYRQLISSQYISFSFIITIFLLII